MLPLHHHSRINLATLKSQISKKLGLERAQHYFYYLSRFLGQKLSKFEFDKLCYATLGHENVPLHNQLVRSILKNAYHAKGPPPPPVRKIEVSKKCGRYFDQKSPSKEDGSSPALTPTPLISSNGDVLPISPCRGRSGIRDGRLRDRPSPLGPNGKTDVTAHQLNSPAEVATVKVPMENGDLIPCDLQRPVQHHRELAEQPESEGEISHLHPLKRPMIYTSQIHDPVSVHNKGLIDLVVVADGDKVEQDDNRSSFLRRPLQAPLGIPFCPASVGGAQRGLPMVNNSSNFTGSYDSGELCDTVTLRKRMEQIVGEEGLMVSMDCANLMNNGLDVYLKRLIGSCIELVGAKSGHEPIKHPVSKQQNHGKVINGVLPGHHLHMQSGGESVESIQERRSHSLISLLDFKVAMELNPQQLGEDWPLVLEKICLQSCEE